MTCECHADCYTYTHLLDPAADSTCPLCKEEPQTLEHWLQRCPTLDVLRQHTFGSPSPPRPNPRRCWRSLGPHSRVLGVRLKNNFSRGFTRMSLSCIHPKQHAQRTPIERCEAVRKPTRCFQRSCGPTVGIFNMHTVENPFALITPYSHSIPLYPATPLCIYIFEYIYMYEYLDTIDRP